MRNFLIALLLALPASRTIAQTADWMSIITTNAVQRSAKKGEFVQPKPGLALYFSRVNGIDQPYLVYVPRQYKSGQATAAVVFLHGAILAREDFQHTDPSIVHEPIFAAAESLGVIAIFPFGRSDLRWSGPSPVYENIMRMVEQAEERYNIDRKRVYIGGISMGGIATFRFINEHPDAFAGFYTFSAMPRLEGRINFAALTSSKPLFSLNARDDQGFSFAEVSGIYEQHKAEAPGWHLQAVETGGHRFIYEKGGEKYVLQTLAKLLKQ